MKKIVLTVILNLLCLTAWCAKAISEPTTVTQKDGTQVTVILFGDEHFHYVTTSDGVLLYQEGTDFFVARTDADGQLYPTRQLAHNKEQRTPAELMLIAQQDKDAFFRLANNRPTHGPLHEPIGNDDTSLFPHMGSPKALVFLADFIDEPFKNTDANTIKIFKAYLNKNGQPYVSADRTTSKNYKGVLGYFSDMSGGLFTPQFDVAALVHLPDSMKVYGAGSDNISLFVNTVCDMAHEQGVDFSQYDANNDGLVDLVYIIYAGYSENMSGNSTDCIWPKSGAIGGKTYDGKTVSRYGVNNEINFSPSRTDESYGGVKQINGIGLFCHEFSHCMGLPDFYPTKYYAQWNCNPAMEYWSVMDGGNNNSNGYRPAAYTAWEREAMGWWSLDTLTYNDMGKRISLVNIDEGGKAYRIMKDGETEGSEYVFIQNIQPFEWNYSLGNKGKGMIATHVDYNKTNFSLSDNNVNNTVGHSRMNVIPADNDLISYYAVVLRKTKTAEEYMASFAGDPYPGLENVTSIHNFPTFSGTMNKSLLDISEDDGVISFYYLVQGEPQDPESPLFNEAYTKWDMAEQATATTMTAAYTSEDDFGNIINMATDFEGAVFMYDDLDIKNIEAMNMAMNAQDESSVEIKVYFTAIVHDGENEEPQEMEYDYPTLLESNTWQNITIALDDLKSNNDYPVDILSIEKIEINNASTPTILYYKNFCFYGQEDVISTNLKPVAPTPSDNAIYSLDGRCLGNDFRALNKGIYILNKRKIVKN